MDTTAEDTHETNDDGTYDRETAPTRDCPDCGTTMYYRRLLDGSNAFQTTEYDGYWCGDCSKGMAPCDVCDGLHHPDKICEPQRKARLEREQNTPGGEAAIPGVGRIDVADLETIGEGTPVYIHEDGCPEDECDGDLIYHLVHSDDVPELDPDSEYEPIAEHCSKFEDAQCLYHAP